MGVPVTQCLCTGKIIYEDEIVEPGKCPDCPHELFESEGMGEDDE